jgi:hypothetical protein
MFSGEMYFRNTEKADREIEDNRRWINRELFRELTPEPVKIMTAEEYYDALV